MSETKLGIYKNCDKCFDKELELLRTAKISAANKTIITEFQNYTFFGDTREGMVSKLSSQLRIIRRWWRLQELFQK